MSTWLTDLEAHRLRYLPHLERYAFSISQQAEDMQQQIAAQCLALAQW